MRLNAALKVILCITLFAPSLAATADTSYAEKAGSAVGVYRNDALNFQLDLESTPYVVVDFSEQMPDASFAAMRFDPLVFLIAIVEDLGTGMTVEQYAEIVKAATIANLIAGDESASDSDVEALGERMIGRYSGAIVDDAFVDHLFEADSELVVELQYRLPIYNNESFKLPGFFEAGVGDEKT
jgi:hypothetical protein